MSAAPLTLIDRLGSASLAVGLGLFAGLATLLVALLIDPLVAPLAPIAGVVGTAMVANPVIGALSLLFFAQLDGIADLIFAPLPVSGFKLLTGVTAAGLVLTAARNRVALGQALQHPIVLLGLAFLPIWGLAIMFAGTKSVALSEGLRLITIYLLLFLVVMAFTTYRSVQAAILMLALTSLITAAVLIVDVLLGISLISTSDAATTARTAEGFNRSSGASQDNPTTAATMMVTGTVIALVHALESRRYRTFMIAVAAVGTVGVVFSFSRSTALVYAIVLMMIVPRYRRARLFGPALMLCIIAGFAMLPFVPESYFERITSLLGGGGDWTLGRRLTYNLIGVDLLLEHPIFGVGPGNFKDLFIHPDYRYLPGRTLLGRQLHNMYLSVAVEYGLIGFSVFMALIVQSLRCAFSVYRAPARAELGPLALALFFGALTYFLVSVFVPNEYNKYTWILPGLCAALWLVNQRLGKAARSEGAALPTGA